MMLCGGLTKLTSICTCLWFFGGELSDALTIDPAVTAELLRCWSCNHTNNCRDMRNLTGVTTTVCHLHQAFCAVVEYQSVSDDDVTYARECQENCIPGCTALSNGYNRMECVSCCSNSLCNHMTGAGQQDSLHTSQILLWVLILKISRHLY